MKPPTGAEPIPCCKPYVGPEEAQAVAEVLASGRLVQGPHVAEFERAVAEYTEVRHAVACSSGTTALHLGLTAMGVQPGYSVMLPAFTFVATANAVLACGARVRLTDIRLDTFCMQLPEAGGHQEYRREFLLPVWAFGNDPGKWVSTHGDTIEDAACALGSLKLTGRAATLSFHATKVITTGEGGMVLTNDAELAERCRFLRDQKHGHGMAYNYRMTEMQGAMGVEQMRKLPAILKQRAAIAGEYDLALDGRIRATIPCAGNYQSYVLLLEPGVQRGQVIEALAQRGVEALPATQYLGDMPHLRGPERYFPNAMRAGTHAMRIPIWPGMTDEQVKRVIDAVKEVLG